MIKNEEFFHIIRIFVKNASFYYGALWKALQSRRREGRMNTCIKQVWTTNCCISVRLSAPNLFETTLLSILIYSKTIKFEKIWANSYILGTSFFTKLWKLHEADYPCFLVREQRLSYRALTKVTGFFDYLFGGTKATTRPLKKRQSQSPNFYHCALSSSTRKSRNKVASPRAAENISGIWWNWCAKYAKSHEKVYEK